ILPTVRSPSRELSTQFLCLGVRLPDFSKNDPRRAQHHARPHSILSRPPPGRLSAAAQPELASPWRTRHEAQSVPDSRGSSVAMTTTCCTGAVHTGATSKNKHDREQPPL